MSCLELRFVNFLLNEYCIVLYWLMCGDCGRGSGTAGWMDRDRPWTGWLL